VYSVTTTNGKGTASYCRHCGRFTKGATAHTTEEHKGTMHRFPHDPNAPPETEKKNDAAPAAGASAQLALVPENQPLDLSHVPQVSTQDFLNRQVDYNFGNMASVSSLQARAPPGVATDLSSQDEATINSFLSKVFGGP